MKTVSTFLFCISVFASAFAQLTRLPVNSGFEEDPSSFCTIGGTTYFIANNNTYGYELYKTDGAPAGTQLLIDINPGSASSVDGSKMIMFNNELYFFANDGTHGFELWKSNGTAAGTQMVKDIYPGSTGSNAYSGTPAFSLAATNQYVYFWARDSVGDSRYGLWRSDGTAGGTVFVKQARVLGTTPFMLGNGNLLFFTGRITNTIGDEPCISDGTGAGTFELKDIKPGTSGSLPQNYTKLGNKVVFTASGPLGNEPYISDGTSAGTVLLKDIYPSTTGSNSTKFYEFNGKVLFYANDSTHGVEPWVTDGTTGGTQLLVDITPGSASSNAGTSIIANSTLAFFGIGFQFWATDGTPAGSYQFMQAYTPASFPTYATSAKHNGRIYFLVRNSVSSADIWSTTNGYDTLRHTFYGLGVMNMVNLYSGGSNLYVLIKENVTQYNTLWKLDLALCPYTANITGNVPLTCNEHSVVLTADSFNTYAWSTGATTSQITVSTPGTYTVSVFDSTLVCYTTDTAAVNMATTVNVPLICGVTVDSATGKNLLVWNKHNDKTGEALFRIEREVTTNVFTPIADVSYDSLSAYLDTAANPQITSYRYRLILLDSCGNVSLPGTAHQTVHLSQNSGINNEVNLIWNSYAGTSYSQQNVQRSVNGGAWVNLATLPGGNTSYTDLAPPTGTLSYQIEVVIDSTCTPSRGAWGVFSNRIQYVATGIETVTAGSFGVYPNPVNGILHIQLPEGNYSGNILVTDATGKQVRHFTAGNRFMAEDMSGLAPGVYTLRHTEGAVKPTYFVKQ